MQKSIVILLALAANLALQWFGHTGGKIQKAGEFFGLSYDSLFTSSIVFNLKFFWVVFLINIAFVYASKTGTESFNSFLAFILIWIAAAPLAALIYNVAVTKEPINYLHIIGIFLIFAGSILISANKEVLTYIKSVVG